MSVISSDDWKRLSDRVSKMMDDLGLENRYPIEMKKLQERLNKMIEEMEAAAKPDGFVPVDIVETDQELIVTVDLPGVDKNNVDISISDDILKVMATRETKYEDYFKQERTCTSFERSISLPVAVKADEAKAKLKDGVLEITLPREIAVMKKRITVE